MILQKVVEAHLMSLFQDSNLCAIHEVGHNHISWYTAGQEDLWRDQSLSESRVWAMVRRNAVPADHYSR